jgi:hypothetical protein
MLAWSLRTRPLLSLKLVPAGCKQLALPFAATPVENRLVPHCEGETAKAPAIVAVAAFPGDTDSCHARGQVRRAEVGEAGAIARQARRGQASRQYAAGQLEVDSARS